MSTVQWIAGLAMATLSVSAYAEPLVVHASTTGNITALENNFYELAAGLQPGMPIGVDFGIEVDAASATVDSGTLTTVPTPYFLNFGVATGGGYFDLQQPWFWGPEVLNRIQLQDNVLNAAGELVDVVEMRAFGRTQYPNITYFMTEHLEFASTTFDDLDAWSILSLEQATLLGGTMHLLRVVESYDATFYISNMDVDVTGFDVGFAGPGAVPPVPEPDRYALLLVGIAGMAALRRRPRRVPDRRAAEASERPLPGLFHRTFSTRIDHTFHPILHTARQTI